MTLHETIEWMMGLFFLIIGLSHIFQAKMWSEVFTDLLSSRYGSLIIASLTLPWGLLIVCGHNVWVVNVPVLVTIIGWLWVIKSTVYALVPSSFAKVAGSHVKHPSRFRIAGVMLIILGSIMVLYLILGASQA